LGQFDAVVSGRHPPDLNRFLNRTSAKCTILQIIFYGPLGSMGTAADLASEVQISGPVGLPPWR